MYELREYQESQKNFLKANLSNNAAPLFKTNIALESPTGSGKSIVMMSFIKELFEKRQGNKIFISTGFNNLVFQMEEIAKQMGLPVKVLIGRSNANCIKKINNKSDSNIITYGDKGHICYTEGFNINDFDVFNKANKETKCIYSECVECKDRYSENCLYNNLINDITFEYSNLLVITNHSTLLYNKELFDSFNGGFIDECQSFADFYEAYLSTEVTPGQLYMLLKDVKENQIKIAENAGLIKFIEHGLKNGQLSKKMMSNFLEINLKGKDRKGNQLTVKTKHRNISKNISHWIETESEYNNYIHPLFEEGEFKGIKIDRFFNKVDFINGSICLISATVDNYTKNIFSIEEEYKEESCLLFDYNKSNLYIYPSFEFKYLKDFISQQKGDKGILLVTRLSLVKEAKEAKEIAGYEFIFDPNNFIDGKKQILCGSKSLFQGIDLPGVDFVAVNKIPFPRYDESYKKKQSYIESTTKVNSFTGYTIPYTENQLIQATGRLWRKPGDVGNVAIFDQGLVKKHSDILKHVIQYRFGINIKNKVYCK